MPKQPDRDFDFLFGHWTVQHRRLKVRLAGCAEWETFAGRSTVQPLLGGRGNVDDNVIELPAGAYRAATVRAFDAAAGQWSIWWLDGRYPQQIDVPMRGRFEAGVGYFFADEAFQGRPIKVRFIWSDIEADRCRWQQAFSEDGGQTWETNWLMDFSRVPQLPGTE